MVIKSLNDLMLDLIKDMHSAESQIVKGLEKMIQKATSQDLKSGLEQHLRETRDHVQRVEDACKILNIKPTGEKCLALEGILNEAELMMASAEDKNALDATIIACAQRVEHYEIATYGSILTYAKLLSDGRVTDLLGQNMEDEKEADANLTDLAESLINEKAMK